MKKLGLALSGGGFRASLYHLGLVRFLRDAGLLSQVSHITSVSGGSIMAAHLVLNWDRYNGSPNEFDAAASELLSFVRLDIRNRIARRFPLTIPMIWARWLLGLSTRQLRRTGLLEYHYQRYLYGDTSLFQLPEKPQLHILATNLSEGCLCSFNRNGLLMVRRQPGSSFRVDRLDVGLATVPMAVAASSAFPGFFPPLVLTGADVGCSDGDFGRQAYTDGGVFDNLGVRMFGCLQRFLLAQSTLSRTDFVDFPVVVQALQQASKSGEETPLRRLGQLLVAAYNRSDRLLPSATGDADDVSAPSPGASTAEGEAWLVSGLGDLLHQHLFHREPLFAGLKPLCPEAEAILQNSRLGGRSLDANDQHWLNRQLLEAAFRQVTGQACFRRLHSVLDGVLVSDVGKRFEVQSDSRAGGVIRTAMRAADILMDRVWQLEIEKFYDAPGFVFAPITDVVEPAEDPTALHPEIQRQVANIRTDLDRFSLLEISGLVRHGYGVGRKACRAQPALFGTDLPDTPPWDPTHQTRSIPTPGATRLDGPSREPAPTTVEARALQASAFRRIWSTLLDYRDWVSYVYVPILVPLLFLMPYFVFKSYQRSHRIRQIIESLTQSSRDLDEMIRLLDSPGTPWTGETPEDVQTFDKADFAGFEVLQDMRILDLRNWKPGPSGKSDLGSFLYIYRRLKVVKTPENAGNNRFRIDLLQNNPTAQVRFPPQQVPATIRRGPVATSASGQRECRWVASFDFEKVPVGEPVDLLIEQLTPGQFLQRGELSTTLTFDVQVETAEMTRWLLLPRGKEYRNFRIVRYQTGKPETVQPVKVVTEYLAEDSTILAYKLLAVDGGYTYEVTWYYK